MIKGSLFTVYKFCLILRILPVTLSFKYETLFPFLLSFVSMLNEKPQQAMKGNLAPEAEVVVKEC